MLLPPNSIREIIKQWEQLKELDNYIPLYDRYKKYFGYLNTGHKGKEHDIFAYNGGLFEPDEILDNIKIDDQILFTHTLKLSDYDYETDIDVNILGHIFEHSLGEIEEVQAELEGQEIEKNKTRRKKDGIFYTPKYITKYIVDNTLGTLCNDKKKDLGINEDEFSFEKRKAKRKELILKLDTYRGWLLKLTICDPACGSGAFLNQALNFLIDEHKIIDELQAKVTGASIVFPDIENKILENNLFGVDLNEESVEIAKLSLWLRTAQKGRKLTSLNNNIKCGNSLIDDPEVAGDKAFNWFLEFPQVFPHYRKPKLEACINDEPEPGDSEYADEMQEPSYSYKTKSKGFEKHGFDVVIGNPPYVRQELFKEIKPYLEKNYKCYNSIADLYTYFIEKGIHLMNIKGKFSFILPNKFLKASYGSEIRKVIKNNVQIDLIFDFDDYPVFEEATTYPIIYVFSKEINKNKTSFIFSGINKRVDTTDPIGKLINMQISASSDLIKKDNWQFLDSNDDNLINKILNNSICLKDVVEDKIFRGVSTGKNDVFIIDKQTATRLKNEKNKNLIREIVTGKEVKRYNLKFDNLYLLYITWEYDLEFDEGIKNYLIENEELLKNRPEVKEGRFNWWCLSRYGSKNSEYLFKPKIIYPRINNECNFFFDTYGEYSLSDNNFFISTDEKYLLSILNSKVIFYYLKSVASTLQGGYLDFRRPYIETIPIKVPINKTPFIEKADIMLSKNKELQELKTKFIKILSSKYPEKKISNKLENWTELDFKAFSKELEKQKVKLPLSEQAEWLEYFEKEKTKAQEVKNIIEKTDKEIDKMVYTLYDLTEKEIKIVECN